MSVCVCSYVSSDLHKQGACTCVCAGVCVRVHVCVRVCSHASESLISKNRMSDVNEGTEGINNLQYQNTDERWD